MKIMLFTPVWKRPEITEICFMGVNRLRTVGDVDMLAVISEDEMIPLCEKYNIKYVMHENQPLGRKKNYGLKRSLDYEWDYLVEIGSDDVLKNEFLALYPWDRDLMCLQDAAWLNTKTGAARRIKDRTGKFGAGRAYSRKVIESMNPMWHDMKFNGLDGDSMFRMAARGFFSKAYESPKPLVIDLKSDVNIWAYHNVGHPYNFYDAIQGLSDHEIKAIKCLMSEKILAPSTEG